VLHALDSQSDLEHWLAAGSEAAVLEVREEQWRFAHDKLREAILTDLPDVERPALHRRIAQALEAVYPNDNTRAETLLEHWQAAGDEAKELVYLQVVARWLCEYGLNVQRARQLIEHGLALAAQMPEADRQRMTLLKQLGGVNDRLGEYPEAKHHFSQSLTLANRLDDCSGRADALHGLGRIEWQEGDHAQATQRFEESLQLAREAGDLGRMAQALHLLGILNSDQALYTTASEYYQQSLAIFRQLANQRGIAVCLINMAVDVMNQGDYTAATQHLSEALAYARAINDRRSIGLALNNLADAAHQQGDLAAALDYISQSLSLDREMDYAFALAEDLNYRADIQLDLQDLEVARRDLHQSLQLAQELGAAPVMLHAVIGFARLFARMGLAEQSAEFAGWVDVHPALVAEMRQNKLNPLLAELQAALSPETLAAAMERGRALDLNAVVQELLELTT
jgi:tetratricopeptide (TPR) repeat protein